MQNLTFAIVILAWISLLLGGSKYIEYLWVKALGSRPFRLFVAPGVIVHEYSHAIACILTGAKIHEIKLFKRDGGHVKHEKPSPSLLGIPFLMAGKKGGKADLLKFRFFSQFLISFAPVLGCLGSIWVMSIAMNQITGESISPVAHHHHHHHAEAATAHGFATLLASADTTSAPGPAAPSRAVDAEVVSEQAENLGGFVGVFMRYLWATFESLFVPLWVTPVLGVVYLWLLLSFTICMAPSDKDFANSFFGIIAVVALLVVVSFALAQQQHLLQRMLAAILPMVAYTTAVMLFALTVTTLLAAPFQLMLRGRR